MYSVHREYMLQAKFSIATADYDCSDLAMAWQSRMCGK